MTEKPLKIFGTPEESAVKQIQNCLRDDAAVAGALMADNHLGYAMPIGGVVAYEDAISPNGVGFDIGCGNKAVKTNFKVEDWLGWDGTSGMAILSGIMRRIQKEVSFGVGRSNPTPIEHAVLESDAWTEIDKQFGKQLYAKARDQLG